MKSFVAIAVLTVLVATICAMPEANSNQKKQLRLRPSSSAASSVAVAQKRSWSPSKLRRSSEEQVQIAEDQPIAAEPEETAVAVEELAADPTATSDESADIVVAVEPASEVDALSAAEEDQEDQVTTSTELPAHSFFSMNFGPMRGGAMAVANSFSTSGGKAFSHAAAHGHRKN